MTESNRTRASNITGIDESRIASFSLDLARLRQLGILIVIEIRGLSQLSTAASYAELGIADSDERRQDLDPGRRYLFPKDVVKRLRVLEVRFRQVLEKFSYPVTGIRPYRWIPFTAYELWRSEWDRLSADWAQVRRDIMRDYDEHVDAYAARSASLARRAWRSVKAQQYKTREIDGRDFGSEAEFVDFIVNKHVSKFPTKKDIQTRLTADYRTAMLAETGDSVLADDKTLTEAGVVAKLEAMRAAELEHAKQMMSETVSPLAEVFSELRRRIKGDVADILASIKSNGFLKGKVVTKAAGLLELFDLMAVHSDSALRDKLVALKSAIGPVGSERKGLKDDAAERDIDSITKTLKEIQRLADDEAADVVIDDRFDWLDFGKPAGETQAPLDLSGSLADDDDGRLPPEVKKGKPGPRGR